MQKVDYNVNIFWFLTEEYIDSFDYTDLFITKPPLLSVYNK